MAKSQTTSTAASRGLSDADSVGSNDSGGAEKRVETNAEARGESRAVDLSSRFEALQSGFAQQEICIQIPSRAEYVRVVRLAVLGVASRMPFSYDDVEDIKLAVSEACNNAILHAANEAARTSKDKADEDGESRESAKSGEFPDRTSSSPKPADAKAAASTANAAGAATRDAGENATAAATVADKQEGAANRAATRDADARDADARDAVEIEASHSQSTVVSVTMTPWPDRLEITIADEGFVPPPGLAARVPAMPRQAPDALRESGLGLFLMQALMDRVEHGTGANSNTLVRLVKYLPRASPRS